MKSFNGMDEQNSYPCRNLVTSARIIDTLEWTKLGSILMDTKGLAATRSDPCRSACGLSAHCPLACMGPWQDRQEGGGWNDTDLHLRKDANVGQRTPIMSETILITDWARIAGAHFAFGPDLNRNMPTCRHDNPLLLEDSFGRSNSNCFKCGRP